MATHCWKMDFMDLTDLDRQFSFISDNHEKMEVAKALIDYLEVEIDLLKKCAECYSNMDRHPNNWFTMACKSSIPHLIIWAKNMCFNYWPAKLLKIDGQLIQVSFFGDHKNADVPATNCFLYSETNPNRSRNTTVLYKSALKVSPMLKDKPIDGTASKYILILIFLCFYVSRKPKYT